MIRIFKRYAMALIASLAVSLPASATTYGTDYTDLWWNQNESGWGVNLIQQYEVIFATLFVYGNDNSMRWYVASSLSGSQNGFTGTLYQTSGPYFGASTFNPASVAATPVGTMSINFSGPYNGTLTYSVNGVNVTKAITRQNWRNDNLTGHYLGGLTALSSACSGVPTGSILIFDNLTVSQSGTAVSMTVDYFNGQGVQSRCTFSGTYAGQGRLGAIANGTWNCTAGTTPTSSGTFSMNSIEASVNGFNASFSGRDQFCTYNGQFGGVKDVI